MEEVCDKYFRHQLRHQLRQFRHQVLTIAPALILRTSHPKTPSATAYLISRVRGMEGRELCLQALTSYLFKFSLILYVFMKEVPRSSKQFWQRIAEGKFFIREPGEGGAVVILRFACLANNRQTIGIHYMIIYYRLQAATTKVRGPNCRGN